LADVITPNLDEAAALVGREIRREDQIRPAAEALHGRHGCAVLVKGGHLRGRSAVDILRDARGFSRFSAPYVRGVSTHGTGCTYSAAIAANLARGAPLRESVRYAKAFVTRAIRQAFRWRHGGAPVDALNHLQSGGTVLP
jgi:hydroxymethylpyrimidine/phosphomethylpyrimidine kinase